MSEPKKAKKPKTTQKLIAKLLKKRKKAALAMVESFPQKYDDILASEAALFGDLKTPVDVYKCMEEEVKKKMQGGGTNSCISKLVCEMRGLLLTAMEDLMSIERFITLTQPKHEDGGNFGVIVQAGVLKTVTELRKELDTKLRGLPDYNKSRAEAAKELVRMSSSEKVTTSEGKSNSTGGKADEGGEKTTSSQTTEKVVSTSESPPLEDKVLYLVQYDVDWWFRLQSMHRGISESYLIACDVVSKNMEKVTNPRGTGGGSGGYSHN